MSFDEMFVLPNAAPLLVLVPVVVLLHIAIDRQRARRLAREVGPRSDRLAAGLCPARRRYRGMLFAGALFLGLLALMQPLWGGRTERRGLDMIICLDVSRSMLAEDLEPDRLGRAKREIRELAEMATGDRIGLIAFAGNAKLLAPLTRDMASLKEIAGRTDALGVTQGGTNLGAALDVALKRLRNRDGRREVVLLLTDGGDHEGSWREVIGEYERWNDDHPELHVAVYCVGLGSALGGKIPVEGGRFLKDAAGRDVVSAMDPSSLREIAAFTDGRVVDASEEPNALIDLYEEITGEMSRTTVKAGEDQERGNRFQWPLLAAFLLWITELCVRERRR